VKNVAIKIKGVSALLMNRFPLEPVEAIATKTPKEQAAIAEYRTDEGALYIPGVNVQRALMAAATYTKWKGNASLQKPVAACVFIDPEFIILDKQDYVIDSRAVVVPATKGRIVRHRPRFAEGS
jgi:hypothetical protein